MKKTILFDVGANDGSAWLSHLNADQNNTLVYMFEPTPSLCSSIKNRYAGLKNWSLIEKAVSSFDGKATFNVQGIDNGGCSSLLAFSKDLAEKYPSTSLWALKHTHSIEVEVITLNYFLKQNPEIDHIDYLHIDAQGSDLNVLKGCSEYIDIVEKGQIEAAYNAPMYEGSPSYIECVDWLESKGFKVKVEFSGNAEECDIKFFRGE